MAIKKGKATRAATKPERKEQAPYQEPEEEEPAPEEQTADEKPSHERAPVCIVCREEKDGSAVKDDPVITTIRGVKTRLGFASNRRLVVCDDCREEHRRRRQDFEKRLVQYGGIGLIILVGLFILTQTLNALLIGVFFLLILLLFSLVQYHPALENEEG
jgi:hypothetical protein